MTQVCWRSIFFFIVFNDLYIEYHLAMGTSLATFCGHRTTVHGSQQLNCSRTRYFIGATPDFRKLHNIDNIDIPDIFSIFRNFFLQYFGITII